MTEYNGPFIHGKMPKYVEKAYVSWKSQNSRCNYKKAISYKSWGAKGICVEYSSKDFVNWYLNKIKKISKEKRDSLVVGRIDHSKNYSFDNIELISRRENSLESTIRNKENRSSLISVYIYKNNELIFLKDCIGTGDAEILTGINRGTIWRYINNKQKSKKCNYVFTAKNLKKRGRYKLRKL